MKTVQSAAESAIEVHRSKFIAHLVPFDAFESMREKLRAAHPKASHIVYAFRHFNDHGQIEEGSSDDGEPRGCAGVPALNVLRGASMVDCAVLIVRYFGGTKLGTGGMARAYAASVKSVLDGTELHDYEQEYAFRFESSYSDIDRILYRLKAAGVEKIDREFGISVVVWNVKGSKKVIEKFKEGRGWKAASS